MGVTQNPHTEKNKMEKIECVSVQLLHAEVKTKINTNPSLLMKSFMKSASRLRVISAIEK